MKLTEGSLSVEVDYKPSPNQYDRPQDTPEPRLIVLHTAECKEVSWAAENLQKWVAGPSRPKYASWHFAVDNDSITQSVDLNKAAFHTSRYVNYYSIGIEQAGSMYQSRAEWLDDYSRSVLENTAQLVAVLCARYHIPVQFVEGPDLKMWFEAEDGAWGISTHREATLGFNVIGGHRDPGVNYPMDWLLERVDQILAEHGLKF